MKNQSRGYSKNIVILSKVWHREGKSKDLLLKRIFPRLAKTKSSAVQPSFSEATYPRFIVKFPDPVHPAPLPLSTQVPLRVLLLVSVPCRLRVLLPFEFTVPD